MIDIEIPGFGKLSLDHLVLDYNGTLALDGDLLPGVALVLEELSKELSVHVITANTMGIAEENLVKLPLDINILTTTPEDEAKLAYVKKLGAGTCACIGNGRNDALMLEAAALGIAVMGHECGSMFTARKADIAAPDIISALNLFRYPLRLIATLRN